MPITAIVVPVDVKEPIRLEEINRHDLNAYRRLVGNGPIEMLNLDRPAASLYLNESGKNRGLAFNPRATSLVWVHNSLMRGRDVIVGPAFIVGPVNRLGDDKTVPDDLVNLLFKTKRYRVEVQTVNDSSWNGNGLAFDNWYAAYVYGIELAQRWRLVEEVRVIPELDVELRDAWYQVGLENPWIKNADDPPFTKDSFTGCYSVEELAERISGASWAVGVAFYYRDLCFINQVEGGDEWLAIRHGIAFESVTAEPLIENGTFAQLVRRLLAASKEQCQRLEY